MIRLTYVLRRKPDMSLEEFQKYWREHHGPLVGKHATTLDIFRYVQVHTLDEPTADSSHGGRGTMIEPYDGVDELWWTSRDALMDAFMTEAGQAAADELLEDEKTFIDLPNSPLWFAYEYPQVNPTPETLVAKENSSILKFYYPLRHLPSLSLDEAQLYWRTNHGPLIRLMAQQMGILRYVQVHRYEDELDSALREPRGTKEEPFTGHAELWFDRADMLARAEMPERVKAAEMAREDESTFVNFSRSAIWLAKEHVFIDRR